MRNARLPAALNPEAKSPRGHRRASTPEVAAILYYLQRRFPASEMLPATATGDVQALSWSRSWIPRCIRRGGAAGYAKEGLPLPPASGRGWALALFDADIICFACIGGSPIR